MGQFFQELKRRNVIRVGIAYLAVAWLLLQVAETLFPAYGFTDAAIRNLVTILIVGLLVAVTLAWTFEWTPEGIFKESDVDASTPATRQDNKRICRGRSARGFFETARSRIFQRSSGRLACALLRWRHFRSAPAPRHRDPLLLRPS